jgi:hypothetical protein
VRWIAALVVLLALSGCSSASAGPEWKAVIRDALDGRLDRSWSCRSLRAAIAHLPEDVGAQQTIPLLLESATGRACDAALAHLERGLTRAEVMAVLGPPTAPRAAGSTPGRRLEARRSTERGFASAATASRSSRRPCTSERTRSRCRAS